MYTIVALLRIDYLVGLVVRAAGETGPGASAG